MKTVEILGKKEELIKLAKDEKIVYLSLVSYEGEVEQLMALTSPFNEEQNLRISVKLYRIFGKRIYWSNMMYLGHDLILDYLDRNIVLYDHNGIGTKVLDISLRNSLSFTRQFSNPQCYYPEILMESFSLTRTRLEEVREILSVEPTQKNIEFMKNEIGGISAFSVHMCLSYLRKRELVGEVVDAYYIFKLCKEEGMFDESVEDSLKKMFWISMTLDFSEKDGGTYKFFRDNIGTISKFLEETESLFYEGKI